MNHGAQRTVAILLAAAAVGASSAAAGDARSGVAAAPAPLAAFDRLDAVASCYRALALAPPAMEDSHAYFVLLDQTTLFDASLKQTITTATRTNTRSSTQFTIATFSAFLGDHYTDIVVAGRTEGPLSPAERDDTSKPKLRNLDLCMTHQIDYARRLSAAALEKSFGGASAEIARSDILASLYDFATHVVHPSTAKSKTLLLASDMLENSSLSSFYAYRRVRKLDPAAELDKVRQKNLLPDLTGVRIFVVGAGLLDPQSAATYRDPQTMLSLEGFWGAYFKAAHAQLVEFGKPQLLGPVQ
jgi:hypothetical protein